MSEAQGQQTCNSEDKNEHAQMCMSARSAKKKKRQNKTGAQQKIKGTAWQISECYNPGVAADSLQT